MPPVTVLGVQFATETILMDGANLFYGNGQFNPLGAAWTSWSSIGGSGFVSTLYRRARGTPGTEVALLTGDILGTISYQGFDGSAFTSTRATIAVAATENWSGVAHGTRVDVGTCALGATVLTTALRIDGSVTVDDIRLMVFDVTGATLKRVSRGAADSGGAGFRVLRIPN